ncbi:Mur ligase family protein, partial [Sphingopyxis terrae]|uniref:Mur ligase family protein n=1 Tax=Sphingopyxis terrae TaxID=33052 RepID=UPI00362687A1
KSTVTGMIGWILDRAGANPTVMNGAVMRNFADDQTPFASALVGDPATYVSEVDESDGSIALYQPDVAVVTNISLDHKSLAELHRLFGDFAAKARVAVVNADDPESAPLLAGGNVLRFGFSESAAMRGSDFEALPDGCRFKVHFAGDTHAAVLRMPGRHNAAMRSPQSPPRALSTFRSPARSRRSPTSPGSPAGTRCWGRRTASP